MTLWSTSRLDKVVTLQRGHDLPASVRGQGSVPVIGSFGITGYHNEARYKGPGVAIGRSGASIGVATYCEADYWPLNTCLFVNDFQGNDPRWVYYLLKSIDFSGYNSGSAQPSLNRNYLAQIQVKLPPVAEQRTISATLGALDDKIASNRRVFQLLLELGKSRYLQLAAEVSDVVSIGDLYEVGVSGVWGGDEPLGSADEPVRVVRGRDIQDVLEVEPSEVPLRFLTRKQVVSRTPAVGEIWTAGSGSLGPTLPVTGSITELFGGDHRVVYSNFVKRLVPVADDSWFGTAWLAILDAWDRGAFEGFRTGTAMPNLDVQALLRGVFVPNLPRESRDDLNQLVEMVLSPVTRAQTARLEALRDSLLPEMLSGRIRVPEAANFDGLLTNGGV